MRNHEHVPGTIECTLRSSGFNFEEPWVLEGILAP